MNEDQMDRLEGFSWEDKTKLWVAVESLRLNEFYKKSSKNLNDILRLLKT